MLGVDDDLLLALYVDIVVVGWKIGTRRGTLCWSAKLVETQTERPWPRKRRPWVVFGVAVIWGPRVLGTPHPHIASELGVGVLITDAWWFGDPSRPHSSRDLGTHS